MAIGHYCNREVVVMQADESIRNAAELMRTQHVGDVVLVEARAGTNVPIGIVTDRDLVVEVMAPGLDPDNLTARDLVTEPLLTVGEQDSFVETVAQMRNRGVRRVPVVDENGGLVGILTVDDILGLAGELFEDLSSIVDRQIKREARQRS